MVFAYVFLTNLTSIQLYSACVVLLLSALWHTRIYPYGKASGRLGVHTECLEVQG